MTNDWKVIVVIDPDGGGRDHAYTVGLHERGQPELFLWARPTDGDDPGADWILSEYDLTSKLDQLGAQLIAGTVAPGATVEARYDAGTTRAQFRLQEPVPARTRADVGQADPGGVGLRGPLVVAPPAQVSGASSRRSRWRSLAGDSPPAQRGRTGSVDFPAGEARPPHAGLRGAAIAPAAWTTVVPSSCWGRSTCQTASPPSGPRSSNWPRAAGLVDTVDRFGSGRGGCPGAVRSRLRRRPRPDRRGVGSVRRALRRRLRHRGDQPPRRQGVGSSEVLWALFDPTPPVPAVHRSVSARRRVRRGGPPGRPPRPCRPPGSLDDEVICALLGLWSTPRRMVTAPGCGSRRCSCARSPARWRGAVPALAIAGYAALDIALPDEFGHLGVAARVRGRRPGHGAAAGQLRPRILVVGLEPHRRRSPWIR